MSSHPAPFGPHALPRWGLIVAALALSPLTAAAQDAPSTPPAGADSAAAAPAAPATLPADSLGGAATTAPAPAATAANPRITATRKARLIGSRNVVRSGPGDSFAIVGVFPAK